MILDINEDKMITAVNQQDGIAQYKASAIILAMGCREIKGHYVSGKKKEIISTGGVRYSVPKYINLQQSEEALVVRFRVEDTYKNKYISVYFDDKREVHLKKRILAPGEMEEVKLTKKMFEKYIGCEKISIKVEDV